MPWHVATLIKDRAQEVQGYEGIFKFRGGKGAKKKNNKKRKKMRSSRLHKAKPQDDACGVR